MNRIRPLRVLAVVLSVVALTTSCKRDADARLPASSLFPKTPPTGQKHSANPFGALSRAETVAEVEPNDAPEQSQPLPPNTIIAGTIGPPGNVPGAQDWFAIAQSPNSQSVLRLELRSTVDCAEIALIADDGQVVQTTSIAGGVAVLDQLASARQARFVRVRCVAQGRGKRQPTGGPYQLQLQSRPRDEGEEREPNETAATSSVTLKPGRDAVGTLAHARDIDLWPLELPVLAEGDAGKTGSGLMLAVTGVPGVSIELQLRAPDGTIRLQRRGTRGAALAIPNLDTRLLAPGTLAALIARRGANAEQRYVISIGPAPEELLATVTEREPNDRRDAANLLTLQAQEHGLLDGPKDVDWFALDVDPGTDLTVTLRCPATVKARLVVHHGPGKPVWKTAESAGAEVQIERVTASQERVWVRVHAVGNDHSTSATYELEATNLTALDAALDLSGLATEQLAPAPDTVTPTAKRPPTQ